MTLITRDPWHLMQQWQNENRSFPFHPATHDDTANIVGGDWVPAVDIKEEADRYVIHADIPGVEPEKIELSMENGMLTIKGERRDETIEEKENYKRVERSYGSFYRRFSLPDNIDAGKISASGKDGVLEIVLPKTEAMKTHKIEIKPTKG